MSENQIIINAGPGETRVALLEGNEVTRLLVERERERDIVGNIYVGVVKRVLPGMQAAFVDIGQDRTAFLYAGDAFDGAKYRDDLDAELEDDSKAKRHRSSIDSMLKEGQTVVAQVLKEPLGSKGARITMYLTLPGRFVVLVPYAKSIGVSKRISDEGERDRLKRIVRNLDVKDAGIIVRTAAEGLPENYLEKDIEYLQSVWQAVQKKIDKARPPSLVFENLPLMERTTRDFYSEDTKKIVVDSDPAFARLKKFLNKTIPGAASKLYLYQEKLPIFDTYGIERDLEKAISTRIDLPSGGYLVIEQTEALTSFDVNTGSFVGSRNVSETIYRTNVEAIEKIVAQIKLRNLGGIIVMDLIDMEIAEHREKIFSKVTELLKDDKEKTNVLRINELGLIQMTRKRTSDSLERRLMTSCPACLGKGRLKSTETLAYECLRAVERFIAETGCRKVQVEIREDVMDWLKSECKSSIQAIKAKFGAKIDFITHEGVLSKLSQRPYRIHSE